MPAFDLAEQSATLSRFDIVGQRSEKVPAFVSHVALFNQENVDINHRETVDVVHMKPPLEAGDRLRVHVAGRIPLTNDQISGIKAWFAKIKDEYETQNAGPRRQYVIDPPWEDVRNEKTGVRRYRRYSCAGFVLDAHRQVDVVLLVIDKQDLPEVTKRTISAAYSDILENRPRLERFGLRGEGPWRLVLAGYVLHALDRSSDEILAEPYVAKNGDELFVGPTR